MKRIIIIFTILFSISYGEITIREKEVPKRIVSMTLGGDEMLLSFDIDENIVALGGKISENEDYSNIVEKAKNFPKAENNLEYILSLKPDFILVADWMDKDRIQHLKTSNVNIFCYKTPKNFNEMMNNIKILSEIFDRKELGETIISNIKNRMDYIQSKVNNLKKRKRVFYYTSSGTTSGKGTTFDSISEIGGFINASSEMGINGRGVISKEKIIEMNPDIILVPTVSQKYKHNEFIDELLKDKSLSNIDAVKNNQVYSVENKYLTAVSQKMILGLEKIVCIVYPEIFSEQEGEK